MATRIQQFESDQPILSSSPISSSARSFESLSSAFSTTGKKLIDQSEQMLKEQSSAMLMDSNAQINKIVTDARIQMMTNPGNASDINEKYQSLLSTAGKIKVNQQDRKKIDYLIDSAKNELSLHAANHNIQQARLVGSTNYWEAYNGSMSDLSNAIASNDKNSVDIISNSIVENAKNALMQNIITPQAYSNINKSIQASYSRAQAIHDLLPHENIDAVKSHEVLTNIYSGHSLDNSSLPSDSATEMMSNHHYQNMVNQDVDNEIYKLNFSPSVLYSLSNQSDSKFLESKEKIIGSIQAHALINANVSYSNIQSDISSLENNSYMNFRDQAKLRVLKDYIKNLEGGGFLDVVGQTTLGSRAVNEWNEQKSAIRNTVSYDLDKSAQAEDMNRKLAYIDNNFINRMTSIAESSHMDQRFIKPIPSSIYNPVQTSFNIDGDPEVAINQISRLTTKNRGYLAAQMRSDTQKEVIAAIGFGYENNMSKSFMSDFINSNKNNSNYSSIKSEDSPKDSLMRAQIANNIPDLINNFSLMGGQEGQKRINGIIESGLNYIKYKAISSGDITISNLNYYVSDFSNEINKAYNISNRRFGSFNLSQINLSKGEQDALQNYVYNEAVKNFQGTHPDDLNFQARLSKTDISIFINNTNHIVAVDSDGRSLFYQPYSDSLLSAAMHHSKPAPLTKFEQQKIDDMQKQFLLGIGD